MTHTPGPWKVDEIRHSWPQGLVITGGRAGRDVLAVVHDAKGLRETWMNPTIANDGQDNAKLIALAPAMKDTLHDAYHYIATHGPDNVYDIPEHLSIIARMEGLLESLP